MVVINSLRDCIPKFDFGVQTEENQQKEVILTEERLESIQEEIVAQLILELDVNRKTINLLTNDQQAILYKMGKFMGDMYYAGSGRNKILNRKL